jgi:5-methylthioadenosine/S-adenosylhomocysteine deaminase
MSGSLLIRGATLVPMDGAPDAAGDGPLGSVRVADLRVRDGRIVAIADDLIPEADEAVLDARGLHALPGFVQGHVHFCQTLFRGLADDLPLMDWLRERIWPLEAAHDASSSRASAELSIAELLRGGATTVQVMESVHHAEQAFLAAAPTGMTVLAGNCLVDQDGPGVPAGWPSADAASALRICDDLRRAFDGKGRLRYVVSPRFVLSCSEDLLRDAAAFAREHDLRLHTHANEHPGEVEEVRRRFGVSYIEALAKLDQLGPGTALAHCVHTADLERDLMQQHGVSVLHCPSTNLKLGSGIAPLVDYEARGLSLALGSDGAPCNNRFSVLTELRQAALLQAFAEGPGAWPAVRALVALTSGGARALGVHDVGKLEVGARGDVVLLDLGAGDAAGGPRRFDAPAEGAPPISQLVWTAEDAAIRHVVVGGRLVVRDGGLDPDVLGFDPEELARRGAAERRAVSQRAGLAR